jgi:hypothetical protein
VIFLLIEQETVKYKTSIPKQTLGIDTQVQSVRGFKGGGVQIISDARVPIPAGKLIVAVFYDMRPHLDNCEMRTQHDVT